MGLQHVGQANANQPYNSRPRKLEYNWMKIPEPQPHLSVSPSFFKCRRCLACRKIVLFCVTTQTNLEAAGGQCSAVGRAGCYQGLPDTSTAPGLTRSHQVSGSHILRLRHTVRLYLTALFSPPGRLKINTFSDFTAVGGAESENFLMFLSKIRPTI